ncbi:MAG: polyhydroxyalkanoate synthesis repressor PhaR [Magnetococcales bacterium]|nr:polyhydroxyalkanoate synthesis repressor PhaR [Magnetococcales bacterium]
MDETPVRIIKKYANRRLYDTEQSAYITLDGVRDLVMNRIPFQVVDNRTGADLTRLILLQIISEQEDKGRPVFDSDALQLIIRFYGDTLQEALGEWMKQSLDAFMDQKTFFQSAPDPLILINEMGRRNLEMWHSLQGGIFSLTLGTTAKKKEDPPPDRE